MRDGGQFAFFVGDGLRLAQSFRIGGGGTTRTVRFPGQKLSCENSMLALDERKWFRVPGGGGALRVVSVKKTLFVVVPELSSLVPDRSSSFVCKSVSVSGGLRSG